MTTAIVKGAAFSAATARNPTDMEIDLLRSHARWVAGLFSSGTFGLLSGIFGLGLSGLSLFGAEIGRSLSIAASCLVAAAFPLLMVAAHCMDKIGETEKRLKLEYCERPGYSEDPMIKNVNC